MRPAMHRAPSDEDWRDQEAALSRPDAAILRAVLSSPPPPVLPPDFAARVAGLAARRAAAPSAWFEGGLALAALALLVLAALLAARWQPGVWSAVRDVLHPMVGLPGWTVLGLALLLLRLLGDGVSPWWGPRPAAGRRPR